MKITLTLKLKDLQKTTNEFNQTVWHPNVPSVSGGKICFRNEDYVILCNGKVYVAETYARMFEPTRTAMRPNSKGEVIMKKQMK